MLVPTAYLLRYADNQIVNSQFSIVNSKRKDVSRLAVQGLADGLQGGEADGLGLAGLQDGKVRLREAHALRQLAQRNLTLSHLYIEVYDNSSHRRLNG